MLELKKILYLISAKAAFDLRKDTNPRFFSVAPRQQTLPNIYFLFTLSLNVIELGVSSKLLIHRKFVKNIRFAFFETSTSKQKNWGLSHIRIAFTYISCQKMIGNDYKNYVRDYIW